MSIEIQMKIIPIKRALLSVSNKTGIVAFANDLASLDIEIISTGGTSQLLSEAGIPHQQVEDMTGLPEMLGGRVKTLHPKIHGGILGRRDEHAEEAARYQIDWIDLVVVNFYPFAEAIKNKQMNWDEAIEYIDIGGPTMVRAAAKNLAWVGVVVDPLDYPQIIAALRHESGLNEVMRKNLAEKVFALTSQYDAMIYQYFLNQNKNKNKNQKQENRECKQLNLQLEKYSELRYGENPHQKACAYQFKQEAAGIFSANQHQGKPLSYNNMLDAEAAWTCVREFDAPACVIVKHANPCGAASASTIEEAYQRAYQADAISAFGGIIALNRPCTKTLAEAMASLFMEVLLAPGYTDDALAQLAAKPNLRVLDMPTDQGSRAWEMKFITGGVLVQEKDPQVIHSDDLKIVTRVKPRQEEIDAMLFAWRVLKHIKSNGILIAKDNATVGIGAGQVSRIDAVDLAVRKAGENIHDAILASDAFFPFRDSIDRIAQSGVRAIIQPGGSVRDDEVIAACNEHGMAMVFTGKRCFRH
jgi:phosphoribosylaminoimidazolecarboxamide formyltransferase / IMP cyclohydrolase